MLRVGLTGSLGSGKSTAARMFAARGAVALSSDAIGRDLMQPGTAVYGEIVSRFGQAVVLRDGLLDRASLARLAFAEGNADVLTSIVHPAVLAEQERQIAALKDDAVVVVESALIFETRHGGKEGWRKRFHRLVLVTARDELKIARFVKRSRGTLATDAALEAEARRRLVLQMPDAVKAPLCDFVLENDRDLDHLEEQVEQVWQALPKHLRR